MLFKASRINQNALLKIIKQLFPDFVNAPPNLKQKQFS